MQYKVDTKELFTDKGEFVKKMQCPIDVEWEDIIPVKNDIERNCVHCNKSVLNVEFLSDDEVVFLVNKRPETCLKVNAKKI
jgi:hypothetical protein